MKLLRRAAASQFLSQCLTVFALFISAAISSVTADAQVTAVPPYSVSVFATSRKPQYYQPDSIAIWKDRIFVGYGNNAKPDGTFGSSTLVEYALDGSVIQTFKVKGHNDGLKVDPKTNLLWSLQNEDANPNLVILDPSNGLTKKYTFSKPAHGGGYDDIAFQGDNVYISASNPQYNPNTKQAIVRATLKGHSVVVTPILLGDANATDIPTGQPVQLNLQDPDSMRFDTAGDLVLDSQADAELIILRHPGAVNQSVFHLPLTTSGNPVQIDDTVFPAKSQGVILVSDRDGETVYSITAPFFGPDPYSAAPTSVDQLNLSTGVLTPVVTGMVSPHGMQFIPIP
jgi:hypothetical protein